MKYCGVFIWLFVASVSFAQKTNDTAGLNKFIANKCNSKLVDVAVNKTIAALDRQLPSLTKSDGKQLLLQTRKIALRHLINKRNTIEIVLRDTNNAPFSNKDFLVTLFNNDTDNFLTSNYLLLEYELIYPDGQSAMFDKYVNVDTINTEGLSNMLFYSESLTLKLDSLRRVKHIRSRAMNGYLANHYKDWDKKNNKLIPVPVGITDITFSKEIIYLGLDMFGSHYLLSFLPSDNYRFLNCKEEWVY